jgi:IS5 family transposase
MKLLAAVDKDSAPIHSIVVTAANVQDLTPAFELPHGAEEVMYGDASYEGIAKRPEMAGKATELRVTMQPGKRRAVQNIPDGRLQDLIQTAKAQIRSKVEHRFSVIKQQFGFRRPSCAAWPRTLQDPRHGSTIGYVPGTTAIAHNSLTRGWAWLNRSIRRQKPAQGG